jgi:hypothetical protein
MVSASDAISYTAGSSAAVGRRRGRQRRRGAVGREEREAARERRQHPQAEQVHLEEPQLRDVVLVPLHDGPARHGGGLDGRGLAERPARDDEAAHVDREVAGEPLELAGEEERLPHGGRSRSVEPRLRQDLGRHLSRVFVGADELRQPVHLREGEAERLAHVADRGAGAVADDLAHHAGVVAAVLLVDVLEHLLPALVLEVDVDVRRLAALDGDEPLEQEPHPHRVDGGDPEAVAEDGVRGAAPALAQDAALAREADDVPDSEEVARVIELLDEIELLRDLALHVGRRRPAPAPPRALGNQRAQERHPGDREIGSLDRGRCRVRSRARSQGLIRPRAPDRARSELAGSSYHWR